MAENETLPAMLAGKQRRSGRLSLTIPIILIGSDCNGKVFLEETHTVVLSLHGAGIVSRHKLIAEQELVVRLSGSNREAEVRVVGEIAKQGEVYTYGVAFVDPTLDFWQMEFPPAAVWRPEQMVLECCGCGRLEELLNGDFEFDICVIHGGLARFCEECGYLTVWKQSAEPAPAVARSAGGERERERGAGAKNEGKKTTVRVALEEPEEKKEEAVALAEAMVGMERRGRVRVKVSYFACVKTERFGEDIVQCVDMSRAGVGFHTKNEYRSEMVVSIAVPFSREAKGAPAIFVRGRIANVRKLEAGMWRCGVEFLR